MPKKIRELKAMLLKAGWMRVAGGGKGGHSTWSHSQVPGKLTLSGNDGDDAKRYQEKFVKEAVRAVESKDD